MARSTYELPARFPNRMPPVKGGDSQGSWKSSHAPDILSCIRCGIFFNYSGKGRPANRCENCRIPLDYEQKKRNRQKRKRREPVRQRKLHAARMKRYRAK